jgi:hypothetical protein
MVTADDLWVMSLDDLQEVYEFIHGHRLPFPPNHSRANQRRDLFTALVSYFEDEKRTEDRAIKQRPSFPGHGHSPGSDYIRNLVNDISTGKMDASIQLIARACVERKKEIDNN